MLPNKMYAASTQKSQASNWKNWVQPVIDKSPEDAVKFWVEHDLKPSTIKQLLSQYRKTHPTAVTAHLFRQLTRMQGAREINAWKKEEAKAAMDLAWHVDRKLYNMILFTLHTGVRKSEMFSLKWQDVDFLTGHVNIRQSKTRRPRSIPMSPGVEKLLQNGYPVGQESEHIFPRCQPNDRLDRLCKETNVRRITWHGLRHSFATLALEARRSPREVADVLGHAKVSTTLDTYWQSTGSDMDLSFLP